MDLLKKYYILILVILLFVNVISCNLGDDDDTGEDPDSPDDDDDDNNDDNNDDNDDTAPDPAVQALLEEYVAFSGEPGIAMAWSVEGSTMLAQTAGFAQLQTGESLTADSLFRIGSGTKPFIAAITMQLVDEGRIELDQVMEQYLPEYNNWPTLTIRHLLAMQSGILDYLNSWPFWVSALANMGQPFTPEQLVQFAIDLGSVFLPGEDCDYSNTNYVLLGMIIERVTGNSIKTELQNRIIDPLSLTSTFLDDVGQQIPELAHGYADAELAGPLLGLDQTLQMLIGLVAPQFIIEGYLMDATYIVHPTFAWTAGGMVSTPRDVATFMRAWISGELASVDAMTQVFDFGDCEILGQGVQYGLGLEWNETDYGDAIGHGGLHFGYSTTTYHIDDVGLTYSVVNNFLPDQLWYITEELLTTMVNAPLPAKKVCRPPEEFLEREEPNLLQVKYRGPILSMEDDESAEGGISGTRLRLENIWRAYNGFGAYAYMNGAYLSVESIGPPLETPWDMRSMTLDLDPQIFSALDKNGYAEVDNNRLDQFLAFAYDIDSDYLPGITKMCFMATPDLSKTAEMYFCEYDPSPSKAGDMVKVFANIPMTVNESEVITYMEMLDMPQCICMDENWNPVPC